MHSTVRAMGLEDGPDDRGPGLFVRTFRKADGTESPPVVTNLKLAGSGRKPGAWLINIATALLLLLAVALYVVSISAQWSYVMDIKHDNVVSWIEAASLDGGMAVFTLLALGLSRAGQAARIERLFIVACALGSAWMNWEAANTSDLRSLTAYVGPPLFLAAVVDRTVSVIRRHYLGDDDGSAWSQLGRVCLYSARMILAPLSTATGARRWVLANAPVPEPTMTVAPAPETPKAITTTVTSGPAPVRPQRVAKPVKATRPAAGGKKSALIKLATEEHGLTTLPLTEVSALATSLAPEVEMHPATARRVLLGHARQLQRDGGAK